MSPPLDSPLGQEISNSLPGRLASHAATNPQEIALREKHRGLWREIRWVDYWLNVKAVAAQFEAWHIGVDDRVAILSGNRPEWLYADLAIQLLGGLSVGVYETSPPEDVQYVLSHSRCRVAICEDQEQVDKVLAVIDELPELSHIVVIEPRGTQDYSEFRLSDWNELLRNGSGLLSNFDAESKLAQIDEHQPAMIIYTSGTTGRPKGAMLSHAGAVACMPELSRELNLSREDTVLSYLPLCHVAEKIYSIFIPLSIGSIVHFGESIDTVREDLAEVSPSAFLGVPRIWEKLHASIDVKMQNASWLKRNLYQWALEQGKVLSEQGRTGLKRRLIDLLVFSALRERIGLNRCRMAFSGAAPIAPELLSWFAAVGVPVLEGFGMTETSGITHFNRPGATKLGSVGQALSDVECQIAEDGEILIRGPNVFIGYLDNEEATKEALDAEGWLHTGDVGQIDDDGFLSITGRKKEIMITAGGKNLSPAHIENTLKTSAYIKEVVAIGDARAYVSALIQIDYEMVGVWATERNLPYTSFPDLAGKAEVQKLIDSELQQLNPKLARVEQVRRFHLLRKELHQDDGELTATQKVRRKIVMEKYADDINSIYAGAA